MQKLLKTKFKRYLHKEKGLHHLQIASDEVLLIKSLN